MQEIPLTWAAWHGDQPFFIRFPSSWDVRMIENKLPSALSEDDIYDRIRSHYGGRPALREMAKSKKNRRYPD